MPLNLNSNNLIIVAKHNGLPVIDVKPDYQPIIVTGFTPTIITGSGGTTVIMIAPNSYVVSSPSSFLPTMLIGSGDTNTQFISGNTWIINSISSGLTNYLLKSTFNVYSGTTAPLTYATIINFNSHSGNTAIHHTSGDTQVQINNSISTALLNYYTTGQTNSQIATALLPYWTSGQTQQAINLSTTGISWTTLGNRPNWLTGTTLSAFEIGHTHQYSGLTGLPNLFTGNTFVASGSTILGYSGNQITIFSPIPVVIDWTTLGNRPNWLTGTTLSAFETGHTHIYSGLTGLPNLGLYETVINFNNYTGTTAPNQFEDKINFNNYTGTTAPLQFANRINFNSHTGDTTIHFKQSGITITEAQVTNLPTDLTYLQTQITSLGQIKTQDTIYVFEHYSSDIGGYEVLTSIPTVLTGATEATALTVGTSPVLIDSYATPVGGLNVTGITAGIWTHHFHAFVNSTAGGRITSVRFDAYKRTSGGTETLLFQSTPIQVTTTAVAEYQNQEAHTAFTGWTATDRLIVKVYGISNNNTTLTLQYASSNLNMYVEAPIFGQTAVAWNNVINRPIWLTSTTLGGFETGHTHSQYALQTAINTYTGTTAIAQFANKTNFNTYTGTTAPNAFASKSVFNTYTGTTAPATYQSKASITTYTGTTAPASFAPFNATITGITGTYTVKAIDANKIIEADGTFTITLPNSMATGMRVDIVNVGTGTITLAASTTLNSIGTKLVTRYTGASCYHRGSNVWIAVGRLST